jgi:predicted GIY-YIG superfamily endonuclease
MSFFDTQNSAQNGCATIIHRPAGDITGVRHVFDEACRLAVWSFPMAHARDLLVGKAPVTACYILASHDTVYFGETTTLYRRLSEHLLDPTKAFAREAFIVTGLGDAAFDKNKALYLQWAFDQAAEKAALVNILKGVNPRLLDLSPWHRATLNRIVTDALRLLYDAGCRAFHSNCASMRPVLPNADLAEPASDIVCDTADPDDTGQMEIGVVATPSGVPEFELAYQDLWARGYHSDSGFVITAGSEIRTLINASVNPILYTRRNALAAAGVLAEIPGLSDRLRLTVSVWFPSSAIAAKVATGAHVASSKWVALRDPKPFVIAT